MEKFPLMGTGKTGWEWKGVQMCMRLNSLSISRPLKYIDQSKFPQAGQIAINGGWDSPAKKCQEEI